jgi:hypothetical protein
MRIKFRLQNGKRFLAILVGRIITYDYTVLYTILNIKCIK